MRDERKKPLLVTRIAAAAALLLATSVGAAQYRGASIFSLKGAGDFITLDLPSDAAFTWNAKVTNRPCASGPPPTWIGWVAGTSRSVLSKPAPVNACTSLNTIWITNTGSSAWSRGRVARTYSAAGTRVESESCNLKTGETARVYHTGYVVIFGADGKFSRRGQP